MSPTVRLFPMLKCTWLSADGCLNVWCIDLNLRTMCRRRMVLSFMFRPLRSWGKLLSIKAVGVFERGPSAMIKFRGVCQESNSDTRVVNSHVTDWVLQSLQHFFVTSEYLKIYYVDLINFTVWISLDFCACFAYFIRTSSSYLTARQ